MSRPTLKSVSTVITKGTTPTTVGGNFTESGIIFIKSESIAGSKHPAPEFYTYIDEATDQKLKRSRLREGDLLVSIAGAYLGKLAIVTKRDVPSNTNQAVGIVRLDPQKADVDYVYYYFSQPHLNAYINKLSSQSSQPNLNLELLGNLEFDPKSIAEQKRIAGVLTAFDAKIELNNRINAELEGMAKLLYDYWFVQFDFPMTAAQATALGKPHLTGHPYRASGGKMIYNETLKRDIPEGWKSRNIFAVSDIGGGATPSKKAPEFWGGDVPFFTPTDAKSEPFCIDTEDHLSHLGLKNKATRLYPKGTLFITARGSVGKAMIISREMAMNQSCYALCPHEGVGSAFLYFHTLSLMNHLRVKSSGSVFDSIVTNDLNFTPAVVPDRAQLEAFNKIAEPMFKTILNHQQQNQELTQLRDWLLPMLMNGQVTVG